MTDFLKRAFSANALQLGWIVAGDGVEQAVLNGIFRKKTKVIGGGFRW
jgi:hypothetical protein